MCWNQKQVLGLDGNCACIYCNILVGTRNALFEVASAASLWLCCVSVEESHPALFPFTEVELEGAVWNHIWSCIC